jgi:hypothetical protein
MDPSSFCDAWLNSSKHRDRSRTTIGGREFPASLPPCRRISPLARLKEPEIISSGLSTQWMNCGNLGQPLCKPCAAASLFGGVIWLRAGFGQWGAHHSARTDTPRSARRTRYSSLSDAGGVMARCQRPDVQLRSIRGNRQWDVYPSAREHQDNQPRRRGWRRRAQPDNGQITRT